MFQNISWRIWIAAKWTLASRLQKILRSYLVLMELGSLFGSSRSSRQCCVCLARQRPRVRKSLVPVFVVDGQSEHSFDITPFVPGFLFLLTSEFSFSSLFWSRLNFWSTLYKMHCQIQTRLLFDQLCKNALSVTSMYKFIKYSLKYILLIVTEYSYKH